MSAYYEDIDEALAEYDDESDDEGLFSRRRKRNRPRYVPSNGGGNRGTVSQTQWARSMDRVGEDVQDTAAAIKRLQADQQTFVQMSLMTPLLLKGKTATVVDAEGNRQTVPVQSDSLLPMLLPMMMLGQSSSGSTSALGGSNNNMMMMMVLMMVMSDRDKPAG